VSIVHFFLRLEFFLAVVLGLIFGRLLIEKWYPREKKIHVILEELDCTNVVTLTSSRGQIYISFKNDLVDVHDAWDSLEVLRKLGIVIRQEP